MDLRFDRSHGTSLVIEMGSARPGEDRVRTVEGPAKRDPVRQQRAKADTLLISSSPLDIEQR